ncbi:MAG: hypothetical protein KDN05_00710, partial [Verrucomicrobiae bacterium]|nr:hypothetical protein [Verrucomicrobiae bacterium]
TLVMSGINTYAGNTLVSAGTLFLSGSLGTGTTQVAAGATIGGTGNIAGHLVFESGAKLDLTGATLGLNSSDILSVGGSGSITLADFTFSDIVGWDAAAAGDGVYTLVDGGASVTFGGATPTASSPHAFSATRFGYFSEGSLQAVIYTVPEPDAALLAGCLGALVLVRRRHR